MNIDRKLGEQIKVAVYYVASQALTNATKHADASTVRIDVGVENTAVRLSIRDDGIGGANPRLGSGLVGINDRVAALGGRLHITSPAGAGTTLIAWIPLKVI